MLNFFSRPKISLDDSIIEWIFNCYAWALNHFDSQVFYHETILVVPDNKHFPGSESTMEGMANLIFSQVKDYAGMAHWPTRLFSQNNAGDHSSESQSIQINGSLRGKNVAFSSSHNKEHENTLAFFYHPQQIKNSAGLITHFANGLSQHLASTAPQLPPGGNEYWPMAREITGIFMGFGLMFTNTASIRRASCCGGGGGQVRDVFLSEEEATYALAVFCVLKKINAKTAGKHLNKYLRGYLKSAMKDCEQRMDKSPNIRLKYESPYKQS